MTDDDRLNYMVPSLIHYHGLTFFVFVLRLDQKLF